MSGSSIFGSPTANATPASPCYCLCILGNPAERLKGIQEQEGRRKADKSCGDEPLARATSKT